MNSGIKRHIIYIITILFNTIILFPLFTHRWGVGGVLQWWGGDWTGSVFRPRGPKRATPRGAALPIFPSPQLATHGGSVGTWRWCACCQWGGGGKNAPHSGCDRGEKLCRLFRSLDMGSVKRMIKFIVFLLLSGYYVGLKIRQTTRNDYKQGRTFTQTSWLLWHSAWLCLLFHVLAAKNKKKNNDVKQPQIIRHFDSLLMNQLSVSLLLPGLFDCLWVLATERGRCESEGHERQRPAAPRNIPGAHWVCCVYPKT